MKRLVTLGITLALVMGLFCFSVNAETVIQGTTDTVTTTYGSNDITIALRARKLRVINTGTAAAGYAGYTPVIVTVTIYNLGNQNCLINNLKFQLTSESAEYTIASYENLSTDLFLADSAYDSNGYLSIHASNEYTYSGGIVCPANSNMTYVGIINVSSNWITETQTWRTVDLSTATFYENLTTTAGDYPCDADPVDLTNIETYLDELVQAAQGIDLSTSSMETIIQTIRDNVTYSGGNYTDPTFTGNNFIRAETAEDYIYWAVRRYIGTPYYLYNDFEFNSNTDVASVSHTIRYPFIISIDHRNDNPLTASTYYYHRIKSLLPATNAYQITFFASDVYDNISWNGSNFDFVLKNKVGSRGYISSGRHSTTIIGYIDVSEPLTIPTVDTSEFITYGLRVYYLDTYAPNNEFAILKDLYIAYSSVNGVSDLSDQAAEASDQMNTIHNQEASYYAQNQAAIEATGLSNYQFSGEQSNGIGAVSNDFTALWNALGSWNSVYIFSMTLTLALTILRHVPNRRKPKEKNSE